MSLKDKDSMYQNTMIYMLDEGILKFLFSFNVSTRQVKIQNVHT